MLAFQILIDGFAISTIYALGALGFTLIFGVSGVLNLTHGATLVASAIIAWYVGSNFALGTHVGSYLGAAAGVLTGVVVAYVTFTVIVRPIEWSTRVPGREKEIFVLAATMLWGIILQQGMAYFFTNTPITVRPLLDGTVSLFGVKTSVNELFIAGVSWVAMGCLWLAINKTKTGKQLLAASMNPRGLTLLGFELKRIHLQVWIIYGVIAGVAGVLLASFLGTSTDSVLALTGSAFSIVVLGGLGSVGGTLLAAFIVGYLETLTAYLISPSLRSIPPLVLLILVLYFRPQGLLGRR